MSFDVQQKPDQTKSPYYKVHLTKTERYVVKKEARRLKRAMDFKQADLVLETIAGREGTKRTLNQRQKRKIIRHTNGYKKQ
jgi:hypothetical protein